MLNSAVVASDALMDAFELAKYQKKLERRHIIAIIVLVAIIPMVIFLIDNMTIYGFLGVCVPVTCLLLGVGLLIYIDSRNPELTDQIHRSDEL